MQWLTRITPKFRVFNSSRISGFIQPSETFHHPVQNAAKLPRVQNAILCWRALIFPKSAASRLIALRSGSHAFSAKWCTNCLAIRKDSMPGGEPGGLSDVAKLHLLKV